MGQIEGAQLAELTEPVTMGLLLAGALFAGFVSGFAGFGTGLAASGFWFLALPSSAVPPLIVLTSIVGQLIGLAGLRRAFHWARVWPFLAGGMLGLPVGLLALQQVSASLLRLTVGVFLVVYAIVQLSARHHWSVGSWGGKPADAAVGCSGGFLAGFAGLPGPVPLVWLQLRGGPAVAQRMTYQPFNLVMVAMAGVGLLLTGQMTPVAVHVAVYCVPLTMLGTWIGLRVFSGTHQPRFEKWVLAMLLVSGLVLVFLPVAQ